MWIYMYIHVNIFKIYAVCVCIYIYILHNKYTQHTHIYYVNKNSLDAINRE